MAQGSADVKSALTSLLWTNPDTNAEFAAQTIPLNLSNYSRILIQYRGQSGDTGNMVAEIPVDGLLNSIREIYLPAGTANVAFGATRTFTASSTGVVVSNAAAKQFPSGDRITENIDIVPYRIYGII